MQAASNLGKHLEISFCNYTINGEIFYLVNLPHKIQFTVFMFCVCLLALLLKSQTVLDYWGSCIDRIKINKMKRKRKVEMKSVEGMWISPN